MQDSSRTPTLPPRVAKCDERLAVGNVTGFSAFATELAGKRIELLKEIFPAIARVGFMHNMGNPVAPTEWQTIKAAVETLGISAELFDIRREPDIAAAFQNMPQRKVDALYVGIDALTQSNAETIEHQAE